MIKYCIINKNTRECVDIQYVDNIEDIIISEDFEIINEKDSEIGELGLFHNSQQWMSLEEWGEYNRATRNALLQFIVDKINPIRWESMNQQEKDTWIAYRQALLDIPQQEDFPRTIIWPVEPS
jgi:hypothetical protein